MIGQKFHGYVVEKLLGKGAMGAVYLVRHEVLDTYYALKVLDPAVVEKDPTYLKRFLREARLATHLRHPNLVAVHDCGHDAETGLYYLVMDYVSGGSLRDALGFEGPFTVERAVGIVAAVASALRAAQAYQVVHRDIKPENIMLQEDGSVKLVDLGIAKASGLGDSVRTKTDSLFGTPAYISPEQAQCSADVDTRADIYSLGIVFFEMLTGRTPYGGGNAAQVIARIVSDEPTPDIRDVDPGLPADVALVVRRMTMKEVNRRLASFDLVLAELAKLPGAPAVDAAPQAEVAARPALDMATLLHQYATDPNRQTATELPRPRRFPRWATALAVLAAIVILAGVLVVILMRN